jgi:hypothetical protein
MAINFHEQASPTATNMDKDVHVKVVKLTFADFTTGGTAGVKAVLPADATILGFDYWKKTAFSGNGITAATLSIGVTGTATKFASAFDVNTPAAGAAGPVSPVTLIMQGNDLPLAADTALLFTGTATTGNPTAGELYITIRYVR